ncbi:sulfotransferase [Rubrobacter naiadicus]|uniref:sulfotransferase n=1 Tax=Rubrobacter naiadicus TaxID=1392641 RepID=UPI00235F8737|nr:sulfotransferase [Rubrobacter naiadicus]
MSRQLIIAGFHRSGTSLTAQLLHRAGLFLGYEMLEANPSNPYGHFEDREVVDLHQQILGDNDLTWQVAGPLLPVVGEARWRWLREIAERRNAEHRLWGFKDPRVCHFLGLWKYVLPDAKVLVVYRHFADSTYSLARRHAQNLFDGEGPAELHRRFWSEPDLALRMWLAGNEALLAFARTHPQDTMVVSMRMLQDGFPLIRALERRWGLGLSDVPVGEVFDTGATTSRSGRQPVSDRGLIGRVRAVWRELEALSRRTEAMLLGEMRDARR